MRRIAILSLTLATGLPAALWIEPGELPLAVTARDYSMGPLRIVGGSRCPRQTSMVQVVGGELPPGITLTPSGYFRGAATEPGTYQFIVRAATECESTQQEYTIEVTGAPVLAVEPASVTLALPHGAPPVEDPIVVQVRSSWNGVSYTANVGDASWIRAIPVSGTTPGPSSPLTGDALELRVDPSRLPPGTYRVLMRVSAFGAANSPVVPVTLRVLPPDGISMGGHGPLGDHGGPADHGLLPGHGALPVPGHGMPAEPGGHGDPHGAAPAGAGGHGAEAAPKAAAPAAPQRLSRPSPPRRRFAASTPKPAPAPAASEKPSPVGKPVEAAKQTPAHGAAPAQGHGAPPAQGHGAAPAPAHAPAPAAAPGHGTAKPEAKPAAAPPKHGEPAKAEGHGAPAAPKHEKH